jgi:transcriptional regulator with XRE-family HTH domain
VHPSRDILLIQSFAGAVKARRHALGFSQEELAHRADIGRTYIGKLELAQNQPSLSVLFRLCKALDVSPEELLADTITRLRKSKQLG